MSPRALHSLRFFTGSLRIRTSVVRMSLGLGLLAFVGCDSAPKTPTEQANPPAAVIPAAQGEAASGSPDAAAAATGSAEAAAPDADAVEAAPEEMPEAEAEAKAGGEADAPAKADAQVEAADASAAEDTPKAAADAPAKVLLIGDSLVATGFGVLLEKGLDANPAVTCYRKGKSATGLARPDFFDWMDEAKRQIEFREPDVVIAIMGGNDGQDLRPRSGKGRGVPWPSEAWNEEYRARLDAFLALLTADGRKVIWVGLPPMGMRSLEKKLVTIRGIQKAAVEALGDAGAYIDTAPYLTDNDGALKVYGKVKGKKREIRADDGIHFTMPGSAYFADQVVPELLNQLGVPDVEG